MNKAKYILGTLVGVMLMLGFQQNTNAEQPWLQLNAVVAAQNIQLHTSKCSVSTDASEDFQAFDSRTADYKISEGMLESLSPFRSTTIFTKTVRYGFTATKQMFNLSVVQLPGNRRQGLSPDTNYIKYSDKYYVYMLGHILI